MTLVVPGIQGNISVYFAKQLIENCLKYFGGSVIFVEYIPYTTNYLYLIRNYVFDEISTAIAEQLEFLHANGRNINDSILIGASFGSRLVVNVGLILKRSDIVVRRIDGNFCIDFVQSYSVSFFYFLKRWTRPVP